MAGFRDTREMPRGRELLVHWEREIHRTWLLEVLFLVCVTSHPLLGVRAILVDLGLSERAEKRVGQALSLLGVLTVAYGLRVTRAVIR